MSSLKSLRLLDYSKVLARLAQAMVRVWLIRNPVLSGTTAAWGKRCAEGALPLFSTPIGKLAGGRSLTDSNSR